VCKAFNADFDGDQMAVHVPLSDEAQWEAANIMSANANILKPGSGDIIVLTGKPLDIILGVYWLTKAVEGANGDGSYFASPNAAILASEYGAVDLRAKAHVMPIAGKEKYAKFENRPFETTVGRLLFNTVLPADYPFINETITKKVLARIVTDCIARYGIDAVPDIVNKVKRFGFDYATRSGISWAINDVSVPKEKQRIVAEATAKVAKIEEDYRNGLLAEEEKRRMNIEIWQGAKQAVEEQIAAELDPMGSVADMVRSGARGTLGNLTQMAGMKGLIQNTAGVTIEVPIISSMIEGLNPIEYFMSTHGARKGLTDTALGTDVKTRNALFKASSFAELPGWGQDDLDTAWDAFQTSCLALARRDAWKPLCARAARLNRNPAELRRVFEQEFALFRILNVDASRDGDVTGYYEPLINGSLRAEGAFTVPVYATPNDLYTLDWKLIAPAQRRATVYVVKAGQNLHVAPGRVAGSYALDTTRFELDTRDRNWRVQLVGDRALPYRTRALRDAGAGLGPHPPA
jgi:hypothetical protein